MLVCFFSVYLLCISVVNNACLTTRGTQEDHERREIVKEDSVSDDFICGLFFLCVPLWLIYGSGLVGKFLYEDLTRRIIGCAIQVHKYLGPGFLESVYEDALCYEFGLAEIPFLRQVFLDVRYRDTVFEKRFKADLMVDEKVIVELKATKALTAVDEAQLLNYLKVTGVRVGLLLNFGGKTLEKMRRIF